jgi:tagatose-1,6-bisphosphate aldolase
VHDLVDFVTQESYLAGKGAAKFIKGELSKSKKVINTSGENGIRYVVPEKINPDNVDDSVNFFMRVDNVYKNVFIEVSSEGKTVLKVKRPVVSPGEMENIKIKKEILENINSDKLIFSLKEA